MDNNSLQTKPRVVMVVQQRDVKGGIASVTNGYYGSSLEDEFDIKYVESYCDGSKFDKLIKALKGYCEYLKVLRSFKPDVAHLHTSFGPSFYRKQPFINMAVRRGIPVIDHCHGAEFDSFFTNASNMKKSAVRRVFGRCRRVIVLSEEWKEKFSDIVPRDRICVVSNYCKPMKSEDVESFLDKRFQGKKILFLGEIGKRKGGYDFADIIKMTVQKIPDAEFVICGDGAKEDVKEIKDQIAKACPGGKVSFPGWVRDGDKDKVLSEAALFLLPSYNEGQPMSILDAMAYGLPVISTNVGGIPQQIENGKSGFLYTPGDTDGFAEGITALLTDIDRYKSASRESLRIASDKYGFEAHAAKIASIYRDVINDGPKGRNK